MLDLFRFVVDDLSHFPGVVLIEFPERARLPGAHTVTARTTLDKSDHYASQSIKQPEISFIKSMKNGLAKVELDLSPSTNCPPVNKGPVLGADLSIPAGVASEKPNRQWRGHERYTHHLSTPIPFELYCQSR